ncbi:MAG TPA: hypothetical protein VM070_00850, partial [Candidatus Saccharimonadales bacterium]|nr:hypothetical protein [Candidatus Saccharimonadales bacterium]
MLRSRACALLLGGLLVSCAPSTGIVPSASPGGTPGAAALPGTLDMTAALARKPLPVADLFDLTRRLRGRQGTPAAAFQPTRTTPPEEGVGDVREYWTYDFD